LSPNYCDTVNASPFYFGAVKVLLAENAVKLQDASNVAREVVPDSEVLVDSSVKVLPSFTTTGGITEKGLE
jgi:hypothetical protein